MDEFRRRHPVAFRIGAAIAGLASLWALAIAGYTAPWGWFPGAGDLGVQLTPSQRAYVVDAPAVAGVAAVLGAAAVLAAGLCGGPRRTVHGWTTALGIILLGFACLAAAVTLRALF